eukprot:CAMPEP_0202899000 /NCGR_PEP_ID=MMETSP1392-20130828/7362_1 /ASSEMBLY_ACC=CAM_ASM_000868 /TAXON_ID=225041 /ORGANISM="Chlamydomonas chlamydogama, Strain SAG 11-48b" /LENGTH=368 /DNA_ID=CAMNT_0049585083 /DNA_START=375 /DNA_END=1481 /DNA_ORIENTATION=-
MIQVWSAEQPDWTCKIDEGPAGVQAVRWTPDASSILVVAGYQIRTTVWSLLERRCHYLSGPKLPDKGITFSPDGCYMAQLERYDCQDHVSVYDTRSWQQLHHFRIDTSDAADLLWSPDGGHLAALDGPLTYRASLYTAQGRLVSTLIPYTDALGIRKAAWNVSGELLAIGSYDQRVRVLNHVTWQPLLECEHAPTLSGPSGVVVYREVDESAAGTPSHMRSPISKELKSKYIICDLPATLPNIMPSMDKPSPKIGVGQLCWSCDSQYLATINENMPNTVWVWDMRAMELGAVLMHQGHVKDMSWAPQGHSLTIVGGNSKVYMWSPSGASIVHIPLRNFQAHSIKWGPGGSSFVLQDHDLFCTAYLAGL